MYLASATLVSCFHRMMLDIDHPPATIEHMFESATQAERFREVLGVMERFVAELDTALLGPADTGEALRTISKTEKLCGTARLLVSKRAAELRSDEADGVTSTAKLVADETGEGVGKARRDLDTAQRLARQPLVEDALRSGDVSLTQAAIILPALDLDPDASSELLAAAKTDSLKELRSRAELIKAAKRSEEEAIDRQTRLYEQRSLRIGSTEDGAVSIRGELPPVEGAAVKHHLEQMAGRIFEEARREGRTESHEAYLADALVRLTGSPAANEAEDQAARAPASAPARGAARPPASAPRTPRAEIILHVDAEALRRGNLEPGERCEIEGVGPVPLSTVEYLFGTAWAKLIISNGVDIASVTHLGRFIPAHLETALSRRDPICQVPGCGIAYNLERDHIIPIEEGGPTELANLVKLCKRHHFLKTYKYWRLVGRPGEWRWVKLRPDQHVVADGDRFNVAPPGHPTAGLAQPCLSPREAVWPEGDEDPDADSAGHADADADADGALSDDGSDSWTQQTLCCTSRYVSARIAVKLSAPLPVAVSGPAPVNLGRPDAAQPPPQTPHPEPAAPGGSTAAPRSHQTTPPPPEASRYPGTHPRARRHRSRRASPAPPPR